MVDLNTNLTTTTDFTEALNSVLSASDGSVDELHAINQAILTGEGIDQIIEAFAEENPSFAQALKNNKNNLKKPDVELNQLMELDIEIPKEVAEKLGLSDINNSNEKTTVNIGNFIQAALKETLKDNENTFGLGNLNSETIDLLCLLLCQNTKSQIINTLKEKLKTKIAERRNLSDEYQTKTSEIAKNEIETIKAAEKAKKMSIVSAVLSAVLAVVVTAISIAVTIATCGAGAVAIAMAAIAVTAAVASAAASIAGAGCTIAALETNDQDKKETLNNASLGLGIASAVLGLVGGGAEIAGSLVSTAAKAGSSAASAVARTAGSIVAQEVTETAGKVAAEAAESVVKNAVKNIAEESLEKIVKGAAKGAAKKAIQETMIGVSDDIAEAMAEATAKAVTKKVLKDNLVKILQKMDTIVTFGNSATQGAIQIATGAMNIESAEKQKELAEIKIELAKLDQEIETLVAFIDALTQDIQKFMEDYLKNEQEAAETLQAKGDIELQLSQKTA